jgi:hypothetical protein
MRLEGMRDVVPYLDRKKALGIGRDGLYRISPAGKLENKGEPILPGVEIREIFPIEWNSAPTFVAIPKDRKGFFLVQPESVSQRGRYLKDVTLLDRGPIVLSRALWVREEGRKRFFAVDQAGNERTFESWDGRSFAVDQFIIASDGTHAWAPNLREGAGLLLVDALGHVQEYPDLRRTTFPRCQIAGDEFHVWLFPSEGGLWLAGVDGSVKKIPRFEEQNVFNMAFVVPAEGGRERLWIIPYDGSQAILFDCDGNEIRGPSLTTLGISNRGSSPPLYVQAPGWRKDMIWVFSNGGYGLASIDSQGTTRRVVEFDRAKPVLRLVFDEAGRFLFRDEQLNYYLVGADGPAVPVPGLTKREVGFYAVASDKAHVWLSSWSTDSPFGQAKASLFRLDMKGNLVPCPTLSDRNFSILGPGPDGAAYVCEANTPHLNHVDADGNVTDLIAGNDRVITTMLPQPDPSDYLILDRSLGWRVIRANKNVFAEQTLFPGKEVEPLPPSVFLAKDGNHVSGWAKGSRREYEDRSEWTSYCFTTSGEEIRAKLNIGGESLDSRTTSEVKLHAAPFDGEGVIKVNLDWPGRSTSASANGRVTITLLDEAGNHVAHGVEDLDQADVNSPGDMAVSVTKQHDILRGKTYHLQLSYTDDLGSKFHVNWEDVTFLPPLLTKSQQNTIGAYLVLLLAIIFLATDTKVFRPKVPVLSRWMPAIMTAGGGVITTPMVAARVDVDGALLGFLLLGSLVVLVPTSLFSLSAFRILARTEPFSRATPLALRINRLRRRLFGEYIQDIRRQIETAQAKASHEIYVTIPAKIEGPDLGPDLASGAQARPADFLVSLLDRPEPERRANVFIESPGGRGKSALLREVMRLLLDSTHPESPIPILCSQPGDDIEAMVKAVLGRNLLSEEALDNHLGNGDFVLVIDGLNETGMTPDALATFLRGPYGKVTHVLVTTRPDERYREAIAMSERWVRVEPQRLDEGTIDAFEAAYRESDARRECRTALPPLSSGLRAACKGPDGTFLPILVRLAIQAGADGTESIAGIYENAFLKLLRDEGGGHAILDRSAMLCLETYWVDGYRTLAYAVAATERLDLLDRLVDASILVSTDERRRPHGGRPRQVKFFHDSMQSYLTARGLATKGQWDALPRAAGDPIFNRARSDLILANQASELFQMCLNVFESEQLLDRLRRDLDSWANSKGRSLSLDNVMTAIPSHLQPHLETAIQANPDMGGGRALMISTDLCLDPAMGDILANVGGLYARIAPLLWGLPAIEREVTP